MVKDIQMSKALAGRLFWRNITANYKLTFLGYFWAFIPSIVVAYGLVAANASNIIHIKETVLPYPAYVMLSMVLWQTFVDALNGPLESIQESRAMLTKINFPREAIIISKMGEVFFNFGIKMILVVAIFLFYKIQFSFGFLLAPIGVFSLIILGTTLGLVVAPLGSLLQDFSRGLTVITSGWIFITPVLYAVPTDGLFSLIVNLNPVTPLLVTTREIATNSPITNFDGFMLTTLVSIIAFFVAWVFFRISIPYVVERIS
jgi:lipopolysaccharide transport system permease protein